MNDELEMRLVTTLSPMLLTLGGLSLSALGIISTGSTTFVDEALSLFAGLSICSAALLIDYALDKSKMPFRQRFEFLGHGYALFSFSVAVMIFFVPLLYENKNSANTVMHFHWYLIPFAAMGLSVFFKMMVFKDKGFWFYAMIISSIACITTIRLIHLRILSL